MKTSLMAVFSMLVLALLIFSSCRKEAASSNFSENVTASSSSDLHNNDKTHCLQRKQ